jgi:hypothetical protein
MGWMIGPAQVIEFAALEGDFVVSSNFEDSLESQAMLFRSRPDQIIAMKHALVKLLRAARSIPCTRQRSSASARAHRPYEFGVKVSVVTTVKHSAGGQFITHVAALPGNPWPSRP